MSALPQISLEQARDFMLARQGLHRPSQSGEDVLHSLVAIQAQYIRNVPIAFWSRSSSVELDWVWQALNDTHQLVKTWCMRMTVHVLLSEELPLVVGAVGDLLRHYETNILIKKTGLTRQEVEVLETQILEALAAGPLEREEIHGRVPDLKGRPGIGWGRDVKSLALAGQVVFAGDGGSVFARRDQWLPDLDWSLPDTWVARMELLRRYLTAYGPARLQDFAYWAGNYVRVRPVFDDLQGELLQVEVQDHGVDYYILELDLDDLLQPPDPPALAMAPKFDPLMLAHKDSQRFVPVEHSQQVARAAGQVEAIILVDGIVQATWRLKELSDRLVLTIEPMKPFNQGLKAQVQTRADQLAAFYDKADAEVNWL